MLHRAKAPNLGLWSPPGGILQPGETPRSGALRELREETGLVPRSMRLAALVAELDTASGEAWLMHLFRASVEPDSQLPDSHREGRLAWVPVWQVPRLAVPPADLVLLERVLDERAVDLRIRLRAGRLVSVQVEADSAGPGGEHIRDI
jgi:8-oxo-dGTP diphosphatase